MQKTLIALAAAGMLASTAAMAQYQYEQPYRYDDQQRWAQQQERWADRAASIDERESRINARIQRGLNDGRINEWEARRLYRELRDIEARERAFKDDGRLSRRETEELHRELDRLVDHVRQEMRD